MSEWKKVEQSPAHDFDKEPEFIGCFISKEEHVGPNDSNLYTFEKKGGEEVAIWGSTVLDTRLKHVKEGEEVRIVFTGLAKEAKRGQNKAKLYDVYHREPEISETEIDDLAKGIE
jgi:hypothetical protein